jgi:hypothetical protein
MDSKKYFDKINKAIDNMTDEEFMTTLKNAGLDKCPICNHENIICANYGFHVKGEIGDYLAGEVRCKDCEEVLFKSDDQGSEKAYEYIDKNKDKFMTLIDLTCDDLNKKYNIPSGF